MDRSGGGQGRHRRRDGHGCLNAQVHPPRDWLATLEWDGRPRLDSWLIHALGAEDTPYHRAIGSKFLIGAVRRVRSPGCKLDNMPVLEGPQDLGKSTAIRTLFSDPWFTDSLPAQLESREAAIALQGVWCVEFAEIEQLIRTEVEIIKAFLSRLVDRYRPLYGKGTIDAPRQGVLIGTTNSSDYLRDATGNRRFWPVRCSAVNLDWLRTCRAQLWAEAASREAAGEPHWLETDELKATARQTQSERLQDDVWEARVLAYVEEKTTVTTAQILTYGLEIITERQTRREQLRISAILKAAGWGTCVTRSAGGRCSRVWAKLA